MTIAEDLAWLKHHIVLLVIVVGLVFGGVYEVESLLAKHSAAEAAKYEAILKGVQDRADANQKAADERESQYQAMVVQLTAQLSARQKQEQQNQQVASTLDASQAAQHIATATGGSAHAEGNNVVEDLPTARQLVAATENLPLLRKDLADLQSLYQGSQGEVKDLKQSVSDQKAIVIAQGQACDKEKADIKAQARKSKTKWAAIVGVIGFIARGFVHF